MDDVTRFWYYLLCEEKGILSPSEKEIGQDMGNILSRFSPEESRLMRRKFRKLWRKAYDSPKTWSSYWAKREPWRRKREVYKMMSRAAEKKVRELSPDGVKEEDDSI